MDNEDTKCKVCGNKFQWNPSHLVMPYRNDCGVKFKNYILGKIVGQLYYDMKFSREKSKLCDIEKISIS